MNYYQGMSVPYYQPQVPRYQTIDPNLQFNSNQTQNQVNNQQSASYRNPISLQGKSVDSIDVVKAMDIPLDGSISYFPLTDGTAIVTKQLQIDGSSKTIIYKPVETKESSNESTDYVTTEEFNKKIKDISNSNDVKDDIKSLKKQLKDLTYDFKKLNDKIEERDD